MNTIEPASISSPSASNTPAPSQPPQVAPPQQAVPMRPRHDTIRRSEDVRPSYESTQKLLHSAQKETHRRQPSVADGQEGSATTGPSIQYPTEVETPANEEPGPPPRVPSRQVARRPRPTSEYYDERPHSYYGRVSYDYPPPGTGADPYQRADPYPRANEYYWPSMEDPYHMQVTPQRPYTKASIMRDTPPRGIAGPPPPAGGRKPLPRFQDPPEDDESDSGSPRKPRPRSVQTRSSWRHNGDTPPPGDVLRLPFTMWMNSNAKNHFVAFLGEFVGTTMFLFFAFAGTQVANIGGAAANSTTNAENGFSPQVLMYISLSFGFSLMVNVWIFFRISGGLFNPACTLAMVLTHTIPMVRGWLLLLAQIVGGIFASFLVSVIFPTAPNLRTTLSDGTSLVRGVFIEAILTAELVFTILMMAKEKHRSTFLAPVAIGLALFVAELVGVYYTGGSLNPARSFGPCVIAGEFDTEHWIYWVGPAAGAVVAYIFYRIIKILEYEMANPGQDEASDEKAARASGKETV
ncbi:hypothetical protein MBLNU230_g3072t1 [Neophaeotheca triangularis]